MNFAGIESFRPYIQLNSIKASGETEYTKNDITLGARSKINIFPTATFIKLDLSFIDYKNKLKIAKDYSQIKFRINLTQKILIIFTQSSK